MCGTINNCCVGLFKDQNEQLLFVKEFAAKIAEQKYLATQSNSQEHYVNIRHLGATIKTELTIKRISLGKKEIETIERVFKGIVGAVTLTVVRTAVQKFLDRLAEKLEQHKHAKEDNIMAKIEIETFVADIKPVVEELLERYQDDHKLGISDYFYVATKAVPPMMRIAASVKQATGEEKVTFVKESVKWIYHEIDSQKPGDGLIDIPMISGDTEVMAENFLLDDAIPSLIDMLYESMKPELDEIENSGE